MKYVYSLVADAVFARDGERASEGREGRRGHRGVLGAATVNHSWPLRGIRWHSGDDAYGVSTSGKITWRRISFLTRAPKPHLALWGLRNKVSVAGTRP